MTIWYILRAFGILYGYLVYIFCFGMMYQEESGNPGCQRQKNCRKRLALKKQRV
jgi:hypothetical protein